MYRSRLDVRWSREDYAQCTKNLRYIGQAMASYEKDFHQLPAKLEDLTPHYLDVEYLRCPLEVKGVGVHYEYFPTAQQEGDVLVSCQNHRQGTVVLQRSLKIRAKQWR